jgi:hypothetical protein
MSLFQLLLVHGHVREGHVVVERGHLPAVIGDRLVPMPAFVRPLAVALLIGCGGTVRSEPVEDASADSTTEVSAETSPTDVASDTAIADVRLRDAGWGDIVIEAEALGPYEGMTAWFLIQNRVMPEELARASGKVTGGTVTVRIAASMPPDHFGVGLNVFIDRDGDAACNGSDPAWFDIIPNRIGEPSVLFTFKPTDESKIACSEIGK